ncbi:hypothetical protein [Sorangium sp. So ce861]
MTCPGGTSVSCYGETVCFYKYTTSSSFGFVQCDYDPPISCEPVP